MKNTIRTNVGSFATAKLQAKMRSILAIIATLAIIGTILAGCASMTIVSVDSVDGPKQVGQYRDIDPKSITLMATYKDGSQKKVNINPSAIVFDNTKVGPQKVTINVAYNKAGSFQTEVLALQSISGPGPSDNRLVRQYMGFEKSEIKVYGNWDKIGKMEIPFSVAPRIQQSGGAPMDPDAPEPDRFYVRDNNDITLTGIDLDKLGTQTITVEYKGLKTSFDITIVPLASLKILKEPLMKEYKVGQIMLDIYLIPMEVEGSWDGLPNKKLPVSTNYIRNYNKDREGKQTLSYSIYGKSATFDINVKK
ncbi:bacterial Ig-like domain-containing protein [Treponema sp. R80B11-R83G3]